MRTVNFIEAINSGKRFRLVGEKTWHESHKPCDPIIRTTVEVLNSQFELEEQKITITESEFDNTLDRIHYVTIPRCREKLKKELGF